MAWAKMSTIWHRRTDGQLQRPIRRNVSIQSLLGLAVFRDFCFPWLHRNALSQHLNGLDDDAPSPGPNPRDSRAPGHPRISQARGIHGDPGGPMGSMGDHGGSWGSPLPRPGPSWVERGRTISKGFKKRNICFVAANLLVYRKQCKHTVNSDLF